MNDQIGASEGRRDDLSKGFRLAQFTIFPEQGQIVPPEGDTVRLEAKAISVLVELAKHPHQILSVDELMDAVWPGRFVEPGNLHTAISQLRHALGCAPKTPKFIRTHQSRGYELIADVTPLADEAGTGHTGQDNAPSLADTATAGTEQHGESRGFKLNRPIVWLLAAVACVVAIAIGYLGPSKLPQPRPTVAVMPFTAPGSERLQVGALGIEDYLLQALTEADDLVIVARRDVIPYMDTTLPARVIADSLDADYLISGELVPDEQGLRLRLTLEDDGSAAVALRTVTGDSSNPADFQERALIALSEALERELNVMPLAVPEITRTMDDVAHLKFLEAQTQWHQRGRVRIDRAIELLQEAVALQPDYAEARLALAQIIAIRPFYPEQPDQPEPLAPAYAEARESLERVSQLTHHLDSEIAALRGSMAREEHRWQEALDQLEQALKINPDNAMAHYWYASLLCDLGRYDEALVHAQEATRLNPFSTTFNNRLALTYLWVGDNQAADRQLKLAPEITDRDGMKVALLNAVRNQEWVSLRGLLVLFSDDPEWVVPFIDFLANPQSADRSAALSTIDAAIAENRIPETLHFPIWWFLGEADLAMEAFDPGEKTQDIQMLWAPEAAPLRKHPAFPELVASVGLTDFVQMPAGAP